MKNRISLAALGLLVVCTASAALAQDTACGALGRTIDGLCAEYCENLDCDANSGGPLGTVEACVGVFDDYRQLAGTAPGCEPDLLCPCLEISYFRNRIDNPDRSSCTVEGSTTSFDELRGDGIWVRQGDGSACGDHDKEGVRAQLAITWEEAEQCRLLIEQAAASSREPCP